MVEPIEQRPAPATGKPPPSGPGNTPPSTIKHRRKIVGAGLGCFPWIAIAIALAVTGYLIYQAKYRDKPPEPYKKTYTVAAFSFYQAYQESVEALARAKISFAQGRALLGGTAETLPETASAETRAASPLFRAAEHFALAMEQIEHAREILKTDSVGLKPHEKICQETLEDILKKYQEAVKIFNEYAKAQYQGSEAKSEKFALSDGNAKWDMADALMTKALAEGCEGDFFAHVKEQKPEFRRKVFESYRDFYGAGFEEQRLRFISLLGYTPPPETLPSPAPGSPPTKVFINTPD